MKPKRSTNEIPSAKYFRTQLDLLLETLYDVGAPVDIDAMQDATGTWQLNRIIDRLVSDGYIQQEYSNNYNITGNGIFFIGDGGYKQQYRNIKIGLLKIKTDFARNVLIIAAFIVSLIFNLLYFFNIISFNIGNIIP